MEKCDGYNIMEKCEGHNVIGKLTGFPPHLENLEKQGQTWKTWKNKGFWGKNLEKYYKTWKKIDLTPKKPKSLNRKSI